MEYSLNHGESEVRSDGDLSTTWWSVADESKWLQPTPPLPPFSHLEKNQLFFFYGLGVDSSEKKKF